MITRKRKKGFKHGILYPAVSAITGLTPRTVKQILIGARKNEIVEKVAEGFEKGYEVGKKEIIETLTNQ